MLEALLAAVAAISLLIVLGRKSYSLFFVVLLTTEFLYIEIWGGVARPYHFFAVLVVLVLARFGPLLLRSGVFLTLLLFSGINLVAAMFSDTPRTALMSFLSFGGNVCIAMATALLLFSGRVDLHSLKRIILAVTLVSVAWGVLQIAAFHFGGWILFLSLEQVRQIGDGFGPSFRTEADTFGKYMVLPFFLFFPDYIEHKGIRNVALAYVVLIVGILMNFTRTAIYGMGAAFIFIVAWYARKGKIGRLSIKSVKLAIPIAIGLLVVVSGADDYRKRGTRFKAVNLLNQEEILEGGSSGFRLESMRIIMGDVMSSTKRFIIGNGWGQTPYYYVVGPNLRTGGGDLITILGYSGLLGFLAYLICVWKVFKSLRSIAIANQDQEAAVFAEGAMFALVGMFVTGQMASYLIAPEYWMLIGVSIYLSAMGQDNMPRKLSRNL